ncbi:DEAD/DEAH box helicase [Persicobacter psychrovividus]|uniref:Helicase n=1 Tax=Persicobacter psychrovividus TaxID=387638 RepID=A0ABM7VHR5_9BACT|nr:helicase [Persicobacter psychrovividus]
MADHAFDFSPYLKNLGIKSPNKMQEACLANYPVKKNLQLWSPTGSGKTLGFLLPILAELDPEVEGVQALIISPSRELALQIESVFKKMRTNYKINSVYGGHPMRTEINNFRHMPSIIVGTPGRLLDHFDKENIDGSTIKHLILDEFDKSLEMGFLRDMADIFFHLPNVTHKFLISATADIEVPEFINMPDAHLLDFSEEHTKSELQLKSLTTADEDKYIGLRALLGEIGGESTIIFCNHKDAVRRIHEQLTLDKIDCIPYHGDLDQQERERAIIKFRNGSAHFLITTDLAGRGLDIDQVAHVIHYQLPRQVATFTHRNGRTARMDKNGTAYVMLSDKKGDIDYLPTNMEAISFDLEAEEQRSIPAPLWTTLFISRGKKDKVNKIDIVGLLCQKGGLEKQQIGKIDVLDFCAFVAVSADVAQRVSKQLREEKIKKRSVRIGIAR